MAKWPHTGPAPVNVTAMAGLPGSQSGSSDKAAWHNASADNCVGGEANENLVTGALACTRSFFPIENQNSRDLTIDLG